MLSDNPIRIGRPYWPNDQVNTLTILCLSSGYGLKINGVDSFKSVPWNGANQSDKPETA